MSWASAPLVVDETPTDFLDTSQRLGLTSPTAAAAPLGPHSSSSEGLRRVTPPPPTATPELLSPAGSHKWQRRADGAPDAALLDQHRRSLAGIATTHHAVVVDMADLQGVTLSRRHTQSQQEYEARSDPVVYQALAGYHCPFEERATTTVPIEEGGRTTSSAAVGDGSAPPHN